MKLYTEEQVIKAIDIAEYRIYEFQKILEQLTPIELPSDEEIEKQIEHLFEPTLNKFGEPKTQIVGQNPHGFNKFKKAFTKGYRAALNQIYTQNK